MIIYFNGNYIKSHEYESDISSLYFKYGMGFYEVILYNGLNICYLEQHINRLETSLIDFGYKVFSESYGFIIKELLSANKLMNKFAKVTVYALIKNSSKYEILITTEPFLPEELKPVELIISPHMQLSYLNRYLTLNQMHFFLAKQFAEIHSKYDSILCDNSKNVLECTSSSLLFSDENEFYTSKPSNRLKSVSLEIISERFGLNEINIHSDSIKKYNYAFIVNSLTGCMPVSKINDNEYKIDIDTARNLKQLITN